MDATPSRVGADDLLDVRLDGRSVVVTGAARGIGAATAWLAASFGARVAVCDRDAEELDRLVARLSGPVPGRIAATPVEVVAEVLDVRDLDAVQDFAGGVRERFGSVDGLVNNAGGTFRASFLDSSPKGDSALVAENFTSVIGVTRSFLPLMSEGASIVNVTSSEAFQAAPGFAVYAAMKAGVENLTKTLALELAGRGIRVNSVAPDGVRSVGDEVLAAQVRAESEFMPPAMTPMGRFAPPEECASVIVFLLGDMSRFVTGSSIHVDGGLHAAGGWHRRERAV